MALTASAGSFPCLVWLSLNQLSTRLSPSNYCFKRSQICLILSAFSSGYYIKDMATEAAEKLGIA